MERTSGELDHRTIAMRRAGQVVNGIATAAVVRQQQLLSAEQSADIDCVLANSLTVVRMFEQSCLCCPLSAVSSWNDGWMDDCSIPVSVTTEY